jgi:hypothetical protein
MSKRKEKKRVAAEITTKNKIFWEKIKTIKLGSDWFDVVIKDKMKENAGFLSHDEREILIDARSAYGESLHCIETLFHEIGHGLVCTFTDLGEDKKEDKAIEYYVDLMANCLVMVMADNTEVFRLILNKIEERKAKYERK